MLKIKGVDIAIEATRRARAQGVDVTLRLVGPVDQTNPSGFSESDLRAAATEPGIEWLGHQDDIAAIWRDADIALLPSLGGEGVPKSLLEAAACGMPLIGTDVAGIRDLVLDGVTGIRVKPGDSDDLARALVTLSGDDALRARYGAAARAHVEQGFSQARVVAQIGTLHEKLWNDISLPQ
jgi:glycosyltransferase involved in cell wall biosynthesis